MSDSLSNSTHQFETAVRKHFAFLESEHDFIREELHPSENTRIVRYETSKLYVFLTYGPPSYEPTMSFGRRGIDDASGGYSFEPGDLVQLDCCKDWRWNANYPDRITRYVAEFARLLATCGTQCLSGVGPVFNEMKTRRDKLIAESNQVEFARKVRQEIGAAWSQKDYKRVVDLYASIEGQLDELDKKRLQFAIDHI